MNPVKQLFEKYNVAVDGQTRLPEKIVQQKSPTILKDAEININGWS